MKNLSEIPTLDKIGLCACIVIAVMSINAVIQLVKFVNEITKTRK